MWQGSSSRSVQQRGSLSGLDQEEDGGVGPHVLICIHIIFTLAVMLHIVVVVVVIVKNRI